MGKIETAPENGLCLVYVDTDDGGCIERLDRDKEGNWLYMGEPTFSHGFYFKPTHWRPLPKPPTE